MPWHDIYRGCFERYGWTEADVSNMTLYAICIAMGAKPKTGRVRMKPEEYAHAFGLQAERQLRNAGII